MVEEYRKLQKKIPQSFSALFAPHLERVNHHFQPGLFTLSWSSVNIEGLLHQANTAVKKLEDIFNKVSDIKRNVIEKSLEEICYYDLYPVDEITNGPKDPTEENHGTAANLKNTKLTSNSWIHKSSRKLQPVSVSSETASNCCSEEIINQVFESLSDDLYNAVYTCVCRSLITLAQLTGCDMENLASELSVIFMQNNKDTKEESVESEFISRSHLESIKKLVTTSYTGAQRLRFKLMLSFKIPNITIDPPAEVAEEAFRQAVISILSISDSFTWWAGVKKGKSFNVLMTEDEPLRHVVNHILNMVNDLKPVVKKQVFTLSSYDFLWSDDMYRQSEEFLAGNPGLTTIQKEVQRFVDLEHKIKECPETVQLGCICLDYSLIKDTLRGFAGSWKSHYANILHQQFKQTLLSVVQYRENVWQQLTTPVQSLEQLHSCITLLEEVQDMENKIDDVYRPIEIMYEQLRSYQLRIPREEVTEVDNLRYKWTELLNLTYVVKETLLMKKEDIFKQELDKQVKSFVVEVIQFRNSFDTQGPAAPGVKPEEAVTRLHDFKQKYQVFDAKRKTLNSVQRLFNIVPKAFPELDRTGKDLQLLGTLYILFQKFIDFDLIFRNTLWAEVDLSKSNKEIEQYWSECLIWNDKLKDWDAYNEMAREVKFYVDIFPLLHELKSKEIRNRHWLQVMSVTGSSFPLEANVLKVSHILDIELLKFQVELMSIAKVAKKEMDFEIQMRKVEEEWSEQVLSFTPYKNRGLVLLVKEDALKLLEELENAQILLAQMLTSKEIDPLREEATTWAEKLKRVSEVLELWVEVQDLWQNLEQAFSNVIIIKCCCMGDVAKEVLLRHFYQEMEICFSSLSSYLGRTRQAFSRFYFLSDLDLLSVLSRPHDIKYLQNHFRSLFGGVLSIDVEVLEEEQCTSTEDEFVELSLPNLDFLSVRSGNEGWLSVGQRSTTYVTDTESLFQRSLKSAGVSHERKHSITYIEPVKRMNAVAVRAHASEMLQLEEQVAIASGVGVWLSQLQETICRSLNTKIYQVIEDIIHGMAMDEWIQKQSLHLRDVMETLLSQKNIDTSDFDWQKLTRFYLKEDDGIQRHEINILDAWYTYGCEFYGAQIPIIMNPVTEKCFLKISQMLQQVSGVVLEGEHGVGKSETIKGLAYLLGKFLFFFTCSSTTEASAIRRVLTGTAADGCWSCFDDFDLLSKNTVSVFMHGASELYDSLKATLDKNGLQDEYKIVPNPNCSLFLTVSGSSGCQDLSSHMQAVFRAVSLVVPNHTVLLKARLTSLGFKNTKALATRLQLISELLKEQLPEEYHHHFSFKSMTEVIYRACQRRELEKITNGQSSRWDLEGGRLSRSSSVASYQHFTNVSSPAPSLKTGNSTDRNRKSNSSNPALVAAKESHALIADALQDVIGPRMADHSSLVFKHIIGDVFMGMHDTSGVLQISHKELERAILVKAEESKLFPHSPWLNKVKQLFNLSLVNTGKQILQSIFHIQRKLIICLCGPEEKINNFIMKVVLVAEDPHLIT
ncbi:Hypothetical predicted protein [Pelobates cultripes]|uniref:Uncharacterized protein n=1 Tax=Pelobates cultripes TaxID=61616 RepID=A0AAD1RDF3_PELCU|nr:Hypothetical predicted protein [Pelobates cultripes]